MDPCPQAPALVGLLRDWANGQRTALHFLAVGGVTVLVWVAVFAVAIGLYP
jgi:hypothetical protein